MLRRKEERKTARALEARARKAAAAAAAAQKAAAFVEWKDVESWEGVWGVGWRAQSAARTLEARHAKRQLRQKREQLMLKGTCREEVGVVGLGQQQQLQQL